MKANIPDKKQDSCSLSEPTERVGVRFHWCQLKLKILLKPRFQPEAGNAVPGGAASYGGGASMRGIPSRRLLTR